MPAKVPRKPVSRKPNPWIKRGRATNLVIRKRIIPVNVEAPVVRVKAPTGFYVEKRRLSPAQKKKRTIYI